jgi:hypothetical protein
MIRTLAGTALGAPVAVSVGMEGPGTGTGIARGLASHSAR